MPKNLRQRITIRKSPPIAAANRQLIASIKAIIYGLSLSILVMLLMVLPLSDWGADSESLGALLLGALLIALSVTVVALGASNMRALRRDLSPLKQAIRELIDLPRFVYRNNRVGFITASIGAVVLYFLALQLYMENPIALNIMVYSGSMVLFWQGMLWVSYVTGRGSPTTRLLSWSEVQFFAPAIRALLAGLVVGLTLTLVAGTVAVGMIALVTSDWLFDLYSWDGYYLMLTFTGLFLIPGFSWMMRETNGPTLDAHHPNFSVIFRQIDDDIKNGRYAEAIGGLTRCLEIDPNDTELLADRGGQYENINDYERALIDLDRAIELKPKFARAIAIRGDTYRMLGRYPEALTDLDRVIELKPKYARAFAHRGDTYPHAGALPGGAGRPGPRRRTRSRVQVCLRKPRRHLSHAGALPGGAGRPGTSPSNSIPRTSLSSQTVAQLTGMLGRYQEALADLGTRHRTRSRV